MSSIDGAETIGKDEVVDDAGPEVVGHAEVFGMHDGQLLEAEERVGRQDERPDLVEVGVGETEGVEHGCRVGRIADGGCLRDGLRGLGAAGTLPEAGFGINVGEEGAGDLSKEAVEVGCDGLWRLRRPTLTSAMVKLAVAASLRGQMNESSCEAAVKRCAVAARRLAIRRERPMSMGRGKRGARTEEGASDWVEDC